MASDGFHEKPFDEGTITKLELFELYSREWLPVFLAKSPSPWKSVHIFDFFAGPGSDCDGVPGSPLRILEQFKSYAHLPGWDGVSVHAHFFDEDQEKVKTLNSILTSIGLAPKLNLDIQCISFVDALVRYESVLADPGEAKLLFIDQFGVSQVSDDVFRRIVSYPVTDFFFFISSSILHRFHGHPSLERKIEKPGDYFDVHRMVLESYRRQLPVAGEYFLAPFSIKKGSNIYGVIFGSAHPKGIDKFLEVAWSKDKINGEADFDINRDGISQDQPFLAFEEFRPTKVTHFERELEAELLAGRFRDERELARFCFLRGMRRQSAAGVLKLLKDRGEISASFRVPSISQAPPRRLSRKR